MEKFENNNRNDYFMQDCTVTTQVKFEPRLKINDTYPSTPCVYIHK